MSIFKGAYLSEISSVWPPYTPYMDATPLASSLTNT
jgi:hypothetical protein